MVPSEKEKGGAGENKQAGDILIAVFSIFSRLIGSFKYGFFQHLNIAPALLWYLDALFILKSIYSCKSAEFESRTFEMDPAV